MKEHKIQKTKSRRLRLPSDWGVYDSVNSCSQDSVKDIDMSGVDMDVDPELVI